MMNNNQPPQQQQQQSNQPLLGIPVNVKAKYKDSIRRLPINPLLTLDQLFHVLSTAFHTAFTRENCLIKYKDDEGDLITTTNEEEWKEARQHFSSPVLYLEILDKKPTNQPVQQQVRPPLVQQKQQQPPQQQQQQQQQPTRVLTPQQPPQQQVISSINRPITPQQTNVQPSTQSPSQHVASPPTVVTQQQPQNIENSWSFAAVGTSMDSSAWSGKFVDDINLRDGEHVTVDQEATKIWLVRNTGSTQWPDNLYLACNDENPSYQVLRSHVPRAKPGEDVQASVTFIPRKTGVTKGYFRLASGTARFGHLCWFELIVEPQQQQKFTPQQPIQQVPQQSPFQVPPQQQQLPQTRSPQSFAIPQKPIDLAIEGVHDVSDDEDDLEDLSFEKSRMEALYQKYSLQLDNLKQFGMLTDNNKDQLVEILEQCDGDWCKAMQEYVMRSSQI